MLFIIAMDVLHRLFTKTTRDGILRKMEPQEIRFQCSLYADGVILFIRPSVQEASAVKEILRISGDATGLKTNLAKCSITPIFGGEDALQDIISILGCQVQQFPIKYLGLPLSTKKIPKAEFQTGRRSHGPEVATLSWIANGEKRPFGLDQISATSSPYLLYDG